MEMVHLHIWSSECYHARYEMVLDHLKELLSLAVVAQHKSKSEKDMYTHSHIITHVL